MSRIQWQCRMQERIRIQYGINGDSSEISSKAGRAVWRDSRNMSVASSARVAHHRQSAVPSLPLGEPHRPTCAVVRPLKDPTGSRLASEVAPISEKYAQQTRCQGAASITLHTLYRLCRARRCARAARYAVGADHEQYGRDVVGQMFVADPPPRCLEDQLADRRVGGGSRIKALPH